MSGGTWNPHAVVLRAPAIGDAEGWELTIDGVPLRHVTGVKVETAHDGLTTVAATFYASVNLAAPAAPPPAPEGVHRLRFEYDVTDEELHGAPLDALVDRMVAHFRTTAERRVYEAQVGA